MSLDRTDRSFIRRALADAVEEIIDEVTDAIDAALAVATGDPAPADAPDEDDDASDADEATAEAGDDENPDDGHVAIPTHAIAGVAQLKPGTRCVVVGSVFSVHGSVARGYASFCLRDVVGGVGGEARVILPRYTEDAACHIRDGAIVAVDGVTSTPVPRIAAGVIRVLAAPPPQLVPTLKSEPEPKPVAPSRPPAPPCWAVPDVISCRVGCGSDAAQWERRPATKYYVYRNARSVYAQCALHGNWLKTDGQTIQRDDIPVYMISAPPVPGATRLRCDRCGPLCDTWLVATDADGRPRLYCSGTTFVDGEHRPLHAYCIDAAVDGTLGLTYVPHPDEA
jgi:hypothetical protein